MALTLLAFMVWTGLVAPTSLLFFPYSSIFAAPLAHSGAKPAGFVALYSEIYTYWVPCSKGATIAKGILWI